jgi:ACT domain-containing protein
MLTIVTVHDVQHWTACRSVVLHPGTELTPAAQQWLAEHQIAVQIAKNDSHISQTCPKPLSSTAEPPLGPLVQDMVTNQESLLTDTAMTSDSGPQDDDLQPQSDIEATVDAQRAIITVLGKDRVGIIARITSLLSASHVNVLDINQTLFGDLFSMNMAVDISASTTPFAALKAALEAVGTELQLKVLIQRQAVFDYMHRV